MTIEELAKVTSEEYYNDGVKTTKEEELDFEEYEKDFFFLK